jgi:hypothetical protein
MLNRYLVIDNFYDEPDKLVDVARDSLNREVLRGNFAGVMTPKAYLGLQQRDLFQTLLNEPQ